MANNYIIVIHFSKYLNCCYSFTHVNIYVDCWICVLKLLISIIDLFIIIICMYVLVFEWVSVN